MVRRQGSNGRYAPESGPIMLRVSFVVHDPKETLTARFNSHSGSRATKAIHPSERRAASTLWISCSRMSGLAPASRRKTRTIGK
jgi:hypothetical protein